MSKKPFHPAPNKGFSRVATLLTKSLVLLTGQRLQSPLLTPVNGGRLSLMRAYVSER